MKRVLFVPDTHRPYHDKKAWRCMIKAAKLFKPDVLIVLGDFADCYGISSHMKSPSRAIKFHDEIVDVAEGLDELDAIGARTKVYVEGNHEYRLEKYLADKARELYGMVGLPDLLNLRKRGWRWVPYRQHYRLAAGFYATHDVGHAGKYALHQSQAAYGVSCVIGHTHRMGTHYVRSVEGDVHLGASFGWLGDRNAYRDYMPEVKARDWVHGFGVGWIHGTQVSVQAVPIVNGRCTLPMSAERVA